jgi:nucleotide-binding universal stress UspA family protein
VSRSVERIPSRIEVAVALTAPSAPNAWALSPQDLHVADQALWFAARAGASVRFVHVMEPYEQAAPEVLQQMLAVVHRVIGPLLRDLEARAARSGVECTTAVLTGRPWHVIARDAHDSGADLVMIGPNRGSQSNLGRLLFGSTSRRLLRKSPVPVWVVDPAGPIGIRKILVAADLSAMSEALVGTANALHEVCGAERLLLHAVSYPSDIALSRLPDAEAALLTYHAEVREHARAFIDRLLGDRRPEWTVLIPEDWVGRSVPQAVAQHDIDLVLLGGLSARPAVGALIGTTAEKILDHAKVSTWVMKPEGWESPVVSES